MIMPLEALSLGATFDGADQSLFFQIFYCASLLHHLGPVISSVKPSALLYGFKVSKSVI